MYRLLTDDERMFYQEISPWIVGSEGADKNFNPIFKEDTPERIKQKYYNYKEEIQIKKAMCKAFDEDLEDWI